MTQEAALGTTVIVQVAIVVSDIEATVRKAAVLFGVEPPEIRLSHPRSVTNILYHGAPTEGRAKLAFFRMGQVALEFIEPIGGPSIWLDHLQKNGPGVHHIAFQIPAMELAVAHLSSQGIEVVQQASFQSGRYVYADAQDAIGVVLELLEIRP